MNSSHHIDRDSPEKKSQSAWYFVLALNSCHRSESQNQSIAIDPKFTVPRRLGSLREKMLACDLPCPLFPQVPQFFSILITFQTPIFPPSLFPQNPLTARLSIPP